MQTNFHKHKLKDIQEEVKAIEHYKSFKRYPWTLNSIWVPFLGTTYQ